MQPVIDTRPLFPILARELNQILSDLDPADWQTPSICPGWTIRDIVAHLLDTALRRLSFHRDGMDMPAPDRPITGYEDLVAFLNHLNDQWVTAARRLSPEVLTGALYRAQMDVVRFFNGLDMSGPAFFPVAWAGEAESSCRFDIAREYTEWWIHQAQVRLALKKPCQLERHLFFPMVDTLMRALPHHYRNTEADPGATVRVTVTGNSGGNWTIVRGPDNWEWIDQLHDTPTATVTLEPETAWQLLSKSLHGEKARDHIEITGDLELGLPLTRLVSVMA